MHKNSISRLSILSFFIFLIASIQTSAQIVQQFTGGATVTRIYTEVLPYFWLLLESQSGKR